MDRPVLFSVDVPWSVELALVGLVLCLLQNVLLAFLGLPLAGDLVVVFRSPLEGLDEIFIETLEIFVFLRREVVEEPRWSAGPGHSYALQDFVDDGCVCSCG